MRAHRGRHGGAAVIFGRRMGKVWIRIADAPEQPPAGVSAEHQGLRI